MAARGWPRVRAAYTVRHVCGGGYADEDMANQLFRSEHWPDVGVSKLAEG
jgi:hypothetical protein